MGLDTTHDCWHGAYSAFHRWRCAVAEAAEMPPLDFMEMFWQGIDHYTSPVFNARPYLSDANRAVFARLPIKWSSLKPDPLHALIAHSDCDGIIPVENCIPIAERLEAIADKVGVGQEPWGHIGNWKERTLQFASGLRAAAAAGENVEFH